MAWEKEDCNQCIAAGLSPAPQYPSLPRLIPTSQSKRNFLLAVNKNALSPPHWGDGSSSHLPAQKQTTVTRDVERGWSEFPWSFLLKAGEGSDGEFAGIGGTAHPLEEVLEYTAILVPLRAASPRCGCWPLPGGGVFPLCLYAAVLGLTTRLYHARVHVVIQNGEEFPRMP